MPNAKEIKNRIKSVKDTQKITNAMYLIASTKLRKAKNNLIETYPYFEFLRNNANNVLTHVNYSESKYFLPENVDEEELDIKGKTAILCITADKGLAGVYNHNVIKETLNVIESQKDYVLYVVGEYGRAYFKKHGFNLDENFFFTAQEPNMDKARKIATILFDKYDNDEISQIFIVYTDFALNTQTQAKSIRILPFHKSHFETEDNISGYENLEIVPSANEVLDTIVRNYVTGYIYSGIVESFCAEQNSRMMAMDSANENAKDILAELNLKYNKSRQNIITQEKTNTQVFYSQKTPNHSITISTKHSSIYQIIIL